MVWIYYIAGLIFIFFLRQAFIQFIGGWSDIFLVSIPFLLWLWSNNFKKLLLLIVASIAIDLLVVRVLPFYTLTSLSSLMVMNFIILPYFAHTTTITKLLIYSVWLVIWRLLLIAWLAVGWFIDGAPLAWSEPIFWRLLGWLSLGWLLALFFLGWQKLYIYFKKRYNRSYGQA